LKRYNKKFGHFIISKFVLTVGDEFQALINAPQMIPDLLWDIETELQDVTIRVGVGFGTLSTPVLPKAVGMDGPAFHHARAAIADAKTYKHLGGVFSGFGNWEDEVLNGFARLLWFHRSRWTPTQRITVHLLRQGLKQSEVSEKLGVSQQAVSQRGQGAGWEQYRAAEAGWRAILRKFEQSAVR
jgi:hypothetical protein